MKLGSPVVTAGTICDPEERLGKMEIVPQHLPICFGVVVDLLLTHEATWRVSTTCDVLRRQRRKRSMETSLTNSDAR